MTKLAQWLLGLILLGGAWATLTFDLLGLEPPRACREVVWPFPVYLLVAFGCYSLATIGYRVATFNDCEDAARELQEQIGQAKKELSRRGMSF
ncbi:PREDICTED: dolichol-phosphate mannosyltransferase subunit 3 [Nanorana parkeri]|uniref:dolichol-phosphate mannosyltransferase subunit 3 n=1 Tax=Nanorana parkeri TaxID=125878 RepID=UPI0008541F8E|nr:PREDICTED: dolichol-phosphate mannosyltransferase subunit 3 [Nanorana parkeri]